MSASDEALPDWTPPPAPPRGLALEGRYVALEPLDPGKADALFPAYEDADGVWDYMPYGPFADRDAYASWVASVSGQADPFFLAIRDKDQDRWLGQASFLRIDPASGSIEVGHIAFSPALQKTRAATEAMALMMGWAFEAGYRRYEWKCNALNRGSRRAAQRLGLSYEGVFRQATVVKGRNRDTAWFAAIDKEWPRLATAFETWLAPENFDADGRQRLTLAELTRPVLVAVDPMLSP